jgi:hypothetical protein
VVAVNREADAVPIPWYEYDSTVRGAVSGTQADLFVSFVSTFEPVGAPARSEFDAIGEDLEHILSLLEQDQMPARVSELARVPRRVRADSEELDIRKWAEVIARDVADLTD